MRSFGLVVFDWNGTLLDDLPLVYLSVCEMFSHYGLDPPTKKKYRQEIVADFMKFYHKHGIPPEISGDDLNQIRKNVFLKHWNDVKLRIGAKSVLRVCKKLGIKKAIVSAEVPEVLTDRLKQFELVEMFEFVHGGAWPKKEALLETIKNFGVEPDRALYVDDTYDGISEAKTLGIKTAGFTNGYNSPERIASASPNFMISNLMNLIPILRK